MAILRDGGGNPLDFRNTPPQTVYTPNQAVLNLVDTTATQTLTNKTINGAITTDVKVLAADATITSSATLASLTGMSWTLVAGATYIFEGVIPITSTTVGGIALGFGLTTATLASLQFLGYLATAADNTTGVSVQSTTATSGTKLVDTKTAAYTYVRINGSFVVTLGGTLALQASQNTSASGGDVTVIKLGSYMSLTRVA